MPTFASTTTSGYSDPLKAQSIKALEQRMKDQLAQQAQQQMPESMPSPFQVGGHVLNQFASGLQQRRTENAAAEGRNELSAIIAQGPKGPDGNWAPEQLAVMSRRDPEFMGKMFQNQHDLKFQGRQLTSEEKRATERATTDLATNRLTNETSAANTTATNASGERRTAAEQSGASGRTAASLASEEERQRQRLAAEAEGRTSTQSHEANQLRLKAELEDAQQQKLFFQQNNRDDKANEQQVRIAKLTQELQSGEARNKEKFEKGQLETKLAQDTEMQNLQRQMTRENVAAQIAASSGDNNARIAAENRRQELQIKADERKQTVANEHADDMAEEAANHKYELQKRELTAAADIAEKKIRAEERDPTKVAKALEISNKTTQKQLLLAKFERAEKDLDHPGGIHIGSTADLKTGFTNWTGVGSKAKAERTTRVNNAMNEMATGSMADTLTGPSTNFELQEFRRLKNDPNVGWDELKDRFKRVLAMQRKDTEAAEKATRQTGGDATNPTKPPDAAAPPAGGGAARSPEFIQNSIANARKAIDGGIERAAVEAELKKNGIDPSLLGK